VNQLQSWYYRQPPAIRVILAINVAVYLLAQFMHLWPPGWMFLRDHVALNPSFPGILFEPWQLVTYNFLHLGGGLGGLIHIGFNMLWLFWVGREYEEMHGTESMWKLYLLTGVGGGLLCLLLAPIAPSLAGGYIHGASASVLGVAMAVAILYPYKQIGLLFFGVVRLLYVVLGFLVIDALLALTSSGVAVAAHWGGALSGFLYAKAERGELPVSLPSFGTSKSSSRSKPSEPTWMDRLETMLGGGESPEETEAREGASGRSPSAPTPVARSEDEIDRILDKISEKGYDALSDEEKQTLYEASKS
jgi:membrane associated rhomboid family serine protease